MRSNYRWMSMCPCIVATLTSMACMGGCGAGSGQRGSAYGYITERQLVVMRDDRVVARVARVFDPANSSSNKVVWTNDGRYVALLAGATLRQEPRSSEQLIVVNTQTGQVRHLPCPNCEDLTPIESHTILVLAWGEGTHVAAAYSAFDLGSKANSVSVPFDPPTYGGGVPVFLSSAFGWVLTTQSTWVGGQTLEQQIEMTKVPDYTNVSLGSFPSNEFMPAAPSSLGPGESPRFAVAFRPNPGECVAQFPVVVFEPNGQSVQSQMSTDMAAAEPPGYLSGVPGGIQVNDLWWSSDRHLYATITSWTCDEAKRAENEKMVLAHHSSVWRLDGNRWVKDGLDRATMVRQVDATTQIELTRPDCIGQVPPNPTISCNRGALYRVHEGTRMLVARNVISISAPPPDRGG